MLKDKLTIFITEKQQNERETMERLQKLIAHAGIASRREAERLIQDGRVTLNGKVVTELGTKATVNDRIEVDHVPIYKEEPVTFLFNKPDNCVSTVSDDKGRRTVLDYFHDIPERIYPIGRLDYHTTGALLLTNDGELANLLMHPRHRIDKVYRAKVNGSPSDEAIQQLRRGVVIDGRKTARADVVRINNPKAKVNDTLKITIHEGRNRQIRKMCEKIGHPVKQLTRERYAFLGIEGMTPGDYRKLSNKEIQKLYQLAKNH